jgi:methylthioribose-1-phosphate isomerase
MLQTLHWTGSALRLLDQTKLPTQTVYVELTDENQVWDAIRRLVVRGAPAIGVAAAFGVYLGVRDVSDDLPAFRRRLEEVCAYLATSRPTAVNLFWAIDRVKRAALQFPQCRSTASPQSVQIIKQRILDEALAMVEDDRRACRAIGENGVKLLRELASERASAGQPIQVLTHCNAGSLVAVAYGTALAPIYVGIEQGLRFHVYADETRPLLQGSRITAFELQQNNVPVTVLCDNMAASLMSAGATDEARKLDAVIVGADRIAANGDTANKIGTLNVAILAKHFGVPFLVAAPTSTIDWACATGGGIPIEQRDQGEVTRPFGLQVAPEGVNVMNPAFDVTPAGLITAIVTERGIAQPPHQQNISQLR